MLLKMAFVEKKEFSAEIWLGLKIYNGKTVLSSVVILFESCGITIVTNNGTDNGW